LTPEAIEDLIEALKLRYLMTCDRRRLAHLVERIKRLRGAAVATGG
jgi:hypothetical protein